MPGDTVAVLAPNVPALLEAHYAVAMAGAVLNALNYRLDARTIAFILGHGNAKLLIADREFGALAREALQRARPRHPACRDRRRRQRPLSRRHRIRGFSRRGRSRGSMVAAGRRMGGDRAQLYLGHHRQPEGRRLSPPRRVFERARQRDHLRARPPFGLSVDAADVPLQRLDLYLGRHRGRRHACLSPPRRAGADLRRDRRAPGDPSVRRADRLEHAGPCAGLGKAAVRPCRRGGDRRRGAALDGDRGDGADGVPRHPPLWPDRELWALDGVRLAGGMGRSAVRRAGRAYGAAGGAIPDARPSARRRPGDACRTCRPTGRRSAN